MNRPDPFDQIWDHYHTRHATMASQSGPLYQRGEPTVTKRGHRSWVALCPLVLFAGLGVAVGLTTWPIAVQVALWSVLAFLALAAVTASRNKAL